MKIGELLKIGLAIYHCENVIDYRRVLVFVIRGLWYRHEMKMLTTFFQTNPLRQRILAAKPSFFAQLTRCVFYRSAGVKERLDIILVSFLLLENHFNEAALRRLYLGAGLLLWQGRYDGKNVAINLRYDDGQYKEGALTLEVTMNAQHIYRVNFWLAAGSIKNSEIYVGALQGAKNGLLMHKELTKQCWGYRPKNLVMFALRVFANYINASKIYAVSNYGFYANNHLRVNRKLKTSLDGFWQELGGTQAADARFYVLPLAEARKSLSDIPSHKRNVYRKRFAFLDRLELDIKKSMRDFVRAKDNSSGMIGIGGLWDKIC